MITIMSTGRSPHLLFMLIVLISVLSPKAVSGFNSGMEDNRIIKCIERERNALLMLKQGLVDDYGSLSSWGSEDDKKDCCKWQGVSCSNRTGHVVKLDLHGSYDYVDRFGPNLINYLRGNLSSSMLELQQLNHLNLRFNDFGGQPIPEFIGSLKKLRHLDLSYSGFGGRVPSQLGNLSKLQYLGLRGSGMYASKLEWLSHLSFLRQLGLDRVNLTQAVDWLQVISELPSLTEVLLFNCSLPSVTSSSSISLVNSSKSLSLLDLSYNNLSNSIYLWLSNFSSSLVVLDLCSNKLQGPIPEFVLSNMTALRYLDLSSNKLQGPIPEFVLSNMTALRYLDLSSNKLQGPIPEFVFSKMTALQYLNLLSNKLHGPIPKYAFSNMNSLQRLALSQNQIDGISPKAFTNTCNLKILTLNSNNLTVQLSDLVFNLSSCTKHSLEILMLEMNMLGGSLPDLSEFISLKRLYMRNNQLNAITPRSIGQLFKLEFLEISSNSLEGTITEAHMSNLPQLKYLDLSLNLLTFNFISGWVPPFQIELIKLRNCKLGPYFPRWLLNQRNYSVFDISNTGISDTIPIQFWELSPKLTYLNLSSNHMRGILPDLSLKFFNYPILDLSFNDFEGPIPLFSSKVSSLLLSQNKFSGLISFLCSISRKHFWHLDLSNNLLLGELPNCSWPIENLIVLNLANNKFFGKFPSLVGPKCSLKMLKLRNNHFIGELPQSFNMCNKLKIFDVGDNKFSGTIPLWIGDNLANLIILALRSNQFNGSIPLQLCKLSHLQLMDFSLNNISGTIPKCFNNLTAMVQTSSLESTIEIPYAYYSNGLDLIFRTGYENAAIIMWKGVDREYKRNLGYLKCIDLSSNELFGGIPIEITSLEGLRSLNLSRNSLTGSITTKIGNLTLLDSLDLSNNKLIGEIPPSFSSLNFLGKLDLSNNNLSGKIPVNTKLQSFDAPAYMGNPNLCGLPLLNKCSEPEVPAIITHDNSDDDVIATLEFYVCLAIGFIIGFWGVLGSLFLNRSWRHAYFQFLNHAKDRLYIAMIVNIAKLQRWLMTRS